ncbi:DUF1152 domain-containing protein [Streptomyces parvulus]|uniref:DUF1152 domain-containing protein n=1 Tax=Streptomyces parvulus TaxID=146923 RepID=UPI00210CEBBC|nr:DUF1152 domain-containing protein [Streptomyces parvulus]MCQ4195172.1 DUF1152 domain-containing protein [Streptomyces parvulus]
MSDLYVAAGGGGDPVGTLIAARALGGGPAGRSGPPLIATYAWERREVDPTAALLGVDDFEDLARPAGTGPTGFAAFTPATRVRPPAGSTLPGLARDLPARLLLLDPAAGLAALARQVGAMAAAAGGRVHVVDVGGDVLTHGDEPGLCSPFGDALTLAACHLAGVPTTVHVAGPGLDGEIEERILLGRLAGSRPLVPGRDAVEAAAAALVWHPSEASALWAAAVQGARGAVRTVRGSAIRLTDASARLYPLPLDEAVGQNPVARALVEERPATLRDAAALSHRLTGIHGLAAEPDPAPGPSRPAGGTALPGRDEALSTLRAAAAGAGHVTLRYAARTLGLTWRDIPALRTLLGSGAPLLRLA